MKYFHKGFSILFFAVAISPSNLTPAQGTLGGRMPVVQAGESASGQTAALYGYIDQHGKVIIQPQFESAMGFAEGRARVLLHGKWGYIDRTGTVVIQPQFYKAEDFSEGLAPVGVGGKWGYVDKQGSLVIPLQFDSVGRFAEGLAAVTVGGKSGYIDAKSNYAVQPQFERAQDFSEGLAAVCVELPTEQALLTRRYWIGQSCSWGYVNKAGNFAIKPQFSGAQSFSQGLAAVQIDGRWGYINKDGAVVIKPQFDRVGPFSEGLAFAEGGGISGALVLQEGKVFTSWGYIDKTGKWAIRSRLHYYYEGPFSEGLTVAGTGAGGQRQWGYANHKGEFVIEPQYKYASPFSEGLARVSLDGVEMYIDTGGKTVLQLPSRSCAGQFAEGLTVYCGTGLRHRPTEAATDVAAFERSLQNGQTLLSKGQYNEAIEAFMTAASEHKGNCPECALGQAEAWAGIRWYGVALMECDEFFKFTSPDKNLNARAHALKGEALINTVDPKHAQNLHMGESELRLALEMNPEMNDVHYNLGFALLKERRDEEGVKELRAYLAGEQNGQWAEQARWFVANPSFARERFAPYFEFTSLQGEHFSANSLRGKVVLLDAWASWCPPCVMSLPCLVKLRKKLPYDGFVLIGINGDRGEDQLRQFIDKKRMQWPEYWDPHDSIFRNLYTRKNYGIPNFVLIDRQGIIRDQHSGWGPFYSLALNWKIRRLLKETTNRR